MIADVLLIVADGSLNVPDASREQADPCQMVLDRGRRQADRRPIAVDGRRPTVALTKAQKFKAKSTSKYRVHKKARQDRACRALRMYFELLAFASQYIPPMPPPWPPGIGGSFFSSGISETSASVVRSSEAMDDEFWSAERTTFAGSMTPALTRSS